MAGEGASPSSPAIVSSETGMWPFVRVWLGVGVQSFGGGPSTLALMRRAVVDDQAWLTDEQFTRDWALCQICPGINLLGMCVLIGRKVMGGAGILLALLGLVLPSVALTVLLSAGFRLAYRTEALQAAVRGAIPATVGLGWLTCLHMGRGVLGAAGKRSRVDAVLTAMLLLASGAVFAWARRSPIVLLLAAGAIGAIYRTLEHAACAKEPGA